MLLTNQKLTAQLANTGQYQTKVWRGGCQGSRDVLWNIDQSEFTSVKGDHAKEAVLCLGALQAPVEGDLSFRPGVADNI